MASLLETAKKRRSAKLTRSIRKAHVRIPEHDEPGDWQPDFMDEEKRREARLTVSNADIAAKFSYKLSDVLRDKGFRDMNESARKSQDVLDQADVVQGIPYRRHSRRRITSRPEPDIDAAPVPFGWNPPDSYSPEVRRAILQSSIGRM
ncbi:MAG: hypothetical protein M1383_06005 [Patescibacteria group bacterium]|nr:hypothetical protein [Patescibacteria group bacterium]